MFTLGNSQRALRKDPTASTDPNSESQQLIAQRGATKLMKIQRAVGHPCRLVSCPPVSSSSREVRGQMCKSPSKQTHDKENKGTQHVLHLGVLPGHTYHIQMYAPANVVTTHKTRAGHEQAKDSEEEPLGLDTITMEFGCKFEGLFFGLKGKGKVMQAVNTVLASSIILRKGRPPPLVTRVCSGRCVRAQTSLMRRISLSLGFMCSGEWIESLPSRGYGLVLCQDYLDKIKYSRTKAMLYFQGSSSKTVKTLMKDVRSRWLASCAPLLPLTRELARCHIDHLSNVLMTILFNALKTVPFNVLTAMSFNMLITLTLNALITLTFNALAGQRAGALPQVRMPLQKLLAHQSHSAPPCRLPANQALALPLHLHPRTPHPAGSPYPAPGLLFPVSNCFQIQGLQRQDPASKRARACSAHHVVCKDERPVCKLGLEDLLCAGNHISSHPADLQASALGYNWYLQTHRQNVDLFIENWANHLRVKPPL
eukprot:1138673-Pelagomonas_calceolata.AAC.1